MYHQEILTPLKMYRSFLRNEHAGNSVEAFDELFRRSGVDPAANAALVKVIRKLEKEIARVKARAVFCFLFNFQIFTCKPYV